MILDFSQCKTPEDVHKVIEQNKKQMSGYRRVVRALRTGSYKKLHIGKRV